MKIQITFVLATILFTLIFLPISVIALKPGPRINECYEQKKAGYLTQSCEQVLCEWNNASRNWPNDTGYYENCDKSPFLLATDYLIYIVPVIFIIGISLILIIRKRKKKSIMPTTGRKVTYN